MGPYDSNTVREHLYAEGPPPAKWRTISAQQYMDGGEAGGDYDEAFVRHPDTGARREVWDVGCELVDGKVAIYTALPDAILVPPSYLIEVR